MVDSVHVLRQRAEKAASRGQIDDALASFRALATYTHLAEHEYVPIVRQLGELLSRSGDARGALTAFTYAGAYDVGAWKRVQTLLSNVPPVDRAMVAAAQGNLREAARQLEQAGRLAGAAVHSEKCENWPDARDLWARLARATANADAYVAALARFNVARCARRCGDASQAREAIVATVRLLEHAADHFESTGRRERAFDCFQVLIAVGRDSRAFEDILEGFVNCTRILREDHLNSFALDYFDSAIRTAAECGETAAAATFAHEASAFARSLGMVTAANAWTMRQAELWKSAADQHIRRGTSTEVVANALLAAISAFAQIGQYMRVGQLYTALALLDLEPRKRAHYAKAATRYAEARDEPMEANRLGGHARLNPIDSDVWYADLIEWEEQGNPVRPCGDIMVDKRWLNLLHRKAMLARLQALRVEAAEADRRDDVAGEQIELAKQLAQLQHYSILSPLEKLFASPRRDVRVAVLQSVETLFYKRSFVVVRDGLRDADPTVLEQATRTLEALQFPHAFDPLASIFRESSDERVRRASLRALAHIDTRESAEFVLGIIEHGAPLDRSAALAALHGVRSPRFIEATRAALANASPPMRTTLREVLSTLGA